MLTSSLAPYLYWAKTRHPAAIDLAGSNLLHCTLDDLPGARDAVDLAAANDNGYPPLLAAIAAHYGVTADRVITAPGCAGANFIAIAALVGPGDDVLIEQPTYDPLLGACQLMGATVHRFPRRFEDHYAVDLDAVRRALTPRTRLIIATSPHNPSGAVLNPSPLTALGRLASSVGAAVLVDEVYFDATRLSAPVGAEMRPAATLDGPFISTSSLTKSYGLAGLRCGWAVAPPEIAERIRRTRDLTDSVSSAPADRLSAFAFAHLPHLAARTARLLAANLSVIRRFLHDHSALEVAFPPAGSVTFPRIAGLDDAGPFIERLASTFGVAVAPGRFFDAPAHFRISLAGRTSALEAGLVALGHALESETRHANH